MVTKASLLKLIPDKSKWFKILWGLLTYSHIFSINYSEAVGIITASTSGFFFLPFSFGSTGFFFISFSSSSSSSLVWSSSSNSLSYWRQLYAMFKLRRLLKFSFKVEAISRRCFGRSLHQLRSKWVNRGLFRNIWQIMRMAPSWFKLVLDSFSFWSYTPARPKQVWIIWPFKSLGPTLIALFI